MELTGLSTDNFPSMMRSAGQPPAGTLRILQSSGVALLTVVKVILRYLQVLHFIDSRICPIRPSVQWSCKAPVHAPSHDAVHFALPLSYPYRPVIVIPVPSSLSTRCCTVLKRHYVVRHLVYKKKARMHNSDAHSLVPRTLCSTICSTLFTLFDFSTARRSLGALPDVARMRSVAHSSCGRRRHIALTMRASARDTPLGITRLTSVAILIAVRVGVVMSNFALPASEA